MCTINTTKLRLEIIAKQQGYKPDLCGFVFALETHIFPDLFFYSSTVMTPCYPYESFLPRLSFHFAEATCYLSADLFYVEVLLLPCGEVEEVKVVHHGESPVVSGLCCFQQVIRTSLLLLTMLII